MIPNTKDRTLTSSAVAASGEFSISMSDQAHIMSILRDTIYTDKVLAVLREYSANAWDAHREVGKGDLPIKVTIPTSMSPVLTIRDYGPGLSQDDVFTIYTQYGASTKRGGNIAVGMLGIGSKSGFAYSDSFTVTSWHGGMKRVYIAVLDKSEKGVINQLHEEPCDAAETGIEIHIAVRPNDVLEFHNKARQLFQHFDPRPEINIDLPPAPTKLTRLKNGIMVEDKDGREGEWVAVMGCVPYRINLDSVSAINNNGVGIAEYISNISGALYFDIGAVHISASREELRYTDTTKTALIDKFAALVDEFVQHTLDTINNGAFPFWEKRVRAQILVALKLPVPKNCKSIVEDHVKLKKQPKKSTISVHGIASEGVHISSNSRLVLQDDDRALSGFRLGYRDYLVTKDPKASWSDVEDELKDILLKSELDGMPIISLSSLPWIPPVSKNRGNKVKNAKHTVSSFRLLPNVPFRHPHSQCWEIVKRVPQKDDVFIILEKFCAIFQFRRMLDADKELASAFGATIPHIYGYKTTDKRPITPANCTGVEYRAWRESFVKSLYTDKIKKLLNYYEWSVSANNNYSGRSPTKEIYDKIKKKLGTSHPITKLYKKQQEGKRIAGKFKNNFASHLVTLRTRLFNDERKTEAELSLEAITEAYPLLKVYSLSDIWQHLDEWTHYIQLADAIELIS